MKPSTTYYSMPLAQLIKHDIMEDDLPKGASNTRHFLLKKKVNLELRKVLYLKIHLILVNF